MTSATAKCLTASPWPVRLPAVYARNLGDYRVTPGRGASLTLHHFRWARKVIRLANCYAEALQSSRWLSLQIRFKICRYTTATSCTPRGSFAPTALHALFRRAMTAVASVRKDVSMLVHWVIYDYTLLRVSQQACEANCTDDTEDTMENIGPPCHRMFPTRIFYVFVNVFTSVCASTT